MKNIINRVLLILFLNMGLLSCYGQKLITKIQLDSMLSGNEMEVYQFLYDLEIKPIINDSTNVVIQDSSIAYGNTGIDIHLKHRDSIAKKLLIVEFLELKNEFKLLNYTKRPLPFKINTKRKCVFHGKPSERKYCYSAVFSQISSTMDNKYYLVYLEINGITLGGFGSFFFIKRNDSNNYEVFLRIDSWIG